MNENQVPNQGDVKNTMNSNMNGVDSTVSNTSSISTTPNVNTNVSPVSPIAEIKVEATDSIAMDDNTKQNSEVFGSPVTSGDSQPSNKPPKNEKFSNILLVLLFIFLFAFIMGMPYINEFVQNLKSNTGLSEIEQQAKEEEEKQKQEEESKKPTPTPEDEKTKELVCTSGTNIAGSYTLIQIQSFYYNSKNQVLSSKLVSQYRFTTIDNSYNSLKQQCDNDSLKYLTHEGYSMACSYGDMDIEISHEFDLETFTPIIDGTTNIQANATYQQDLNTIKNNLISQGYTCQ